MNTLISHWPSLLLLALSAVPASYMHVHDHGKLRDNGRPTSFFGIRQSMRKYRKFASGPIEDMPAFWGSTTIFVFITDAYHASQALMRILMSLSVTLAISAPWWAVIAIWWTYAGIHAAFYKL